MTTKILQLVDVSFFMGITSSLWHKVHENEVYRGIQRTKDVRAKKILGPIERKIVQTSKPTDAELVEDTHNSNSKIDIGHT
jgi:hypothetical protein